MSYGVIDNDPVSLFYDQITQLEGREYLLEFFWSTRESAWYMNIYDQDENPLALFVRLVVNWPLLRRFVDPRLPAGLLMCMDTSNTQREIEASTDLGTRCVLTYVSSDDPDLEGVNVRRPTEVAA